MGNLLLIGLPGSGKTTVGRLLARRLALPFLDCDAELERAAGASIRELFAREGEAMFRRRETALLRALCQKEGQIIATGGGAVLSAENRRLMAESGTAVFLDRDTEDILSTMQPDGIRPLLAGDAASQLRQLDAQRRAMYQQCAVLTVCADTAQEAAELIAAYWEEQA